MTTARLPPDASVATTIGELHAASDPAPRAVDRARDRVRVDVGAVLRTLSCSTRLRRYALGVTAVGAMSTLWHAASVTGIFGRVPDAYARLLLPSPSVVLATAWESTRSGLFWDQVSVSLGRIAAGFGIGVAIAVPLGLAMAVSPWANELVAPLVRLLSLIPAVAWIPLAILWFGLGNGAAVFIIALGSLFPVLVSTIQGVRAVDRQLVDAARTLGARFGQLLHRVLLPSVAPYLVAGFRVGLGFAWRVAIAAELLGVPHGIGHMLGMGRSTGRTDLTLVSMATLGLLILAVEELVFAPLERRTSHWCGTAGAVNTVFENRRAFDLAPRA